MFTPFNRWYKDWKGKSQVRMRSEKLSFSGYRYKEVHLNSVLSRELGEAPGLDLTE